MTKKNFMTLVQGVIGGLLFGIGVCMCLLPEWNAFNLGVAVTAAGGISLLALLAARLKGRQFRVNGRLAGKIAFGVAGALVLGMGMCMIMVWNMMLPGIAVGVAGIVMLLCLIPMCFGLK